MEHNIEISTVLEQLYNVSGFRVVLYGADFREIAAYPPQSRPYCILLQKEGGVKEKCHRCDGNAFMQAKLSGKACFYRCSFGLFEAVAPLYHFGLLSGYLMMGQVRVDDGSDRSALISLACEYVKDRAAVEKAVDALPIVSRKTFDGFVTIMTICAEYITLSGKVSPPSKGFSAQVRRYINANYNKKISLDQLCRHFKCSKSTLMTTFKRDCFETVVSYINNVRMEHAVRMLESKELSVNEIALACGFCDQCYFSKLFVKKYHMTPTKYRRQYFDGKPKQENPAE